MIQPRNSMPRLLIVEDDASQMRSLCDIMTDEGFSVVRCASGNEAIRAASQEVFPVAILDYRLPDTTGVQLLGKIQKTSHRLRAIIHTAYGSLDSAKDAIHTGAFAYVEKVGDPAELVKHVHRAYHEHNRHYAEDLQFAVAERTAELRTSEQRYASLVNSVEGIVWEGDIATFSFTFVSPQAEKILGYPRDTWYEPQFWFDHLHPDDRDWALEFCANATKHSASHQFDYRMIAADGRTVWLHDYVTTVFEEGVPKQARGVMFDITERKQLEEEAQDRQAQLSHAMRLNSMGKMVSELAHEINQPLYAIQNFASACRQVMESAETHSDLERWIDRINEQAERAGEIIKRLSQFVRKESPRRVNVDVVDIVTRLAPLWELDKRRPNCHIRLELEEKPAPVLVDRIQIEQVLMNLVQNARDSIEDLHAPEADIEIRSQVNGSEVTIAVIDSGPGIPPGDIDQLFEPYFTTKTNGMGLGLAISRTCVQSHEGKLWAERNATRGMTFFFTLPLAGRGANDDE